MTNDQRKPDPKRLGIRRSSFIIRISAALLATFTAVRYGHAQAHAERPPPIDPVKAEREAKALAADLLSQRPTQDATNTGLLKIRGADDQEREIPVCFGTKSNSTNWVSTYTTLAANHQPPVTLIVVHANGEPNEYSLSVDSSNSPPANARP